VRSAPAARRNGNGGRSTGCTAGMNRTKLEIGKSMPPNRDWGWEWTGREAISRQGPHAICNPGRCACCRPCSALFHAVRSGFGAME
jgi:hypothetical protein